MLDTTTVDTVVDRHWTEALPVLEDYIRIPAKSPAYDPDWATAGHLADAVDLVVGWCGAHAPDDARVSVRELPGLTPVVIVDVPATAGAGGDDTVLLYGHLDKQPEMTGWREGLGPWTPVLEGDRLYGRGGGDDGYSAFAALAAIDAVRQSGGEHRRCLVLIEASEESGSPDLPPHLEAMGDELGDVSLIVGLDSGAADYDGLWVTTSLRGMVQLDLRVDVVERGMHSGLVGGLAPSSMRIARRLLDRVEDSETGRILVESMHVEIPAERVADAERAAAQGYDPLDDVPFSGSTRSDAAGSVEAQLASCWRPVMATIGIDGVPAVADAGAVLRPFTTLGLSFRVPPTCDAERAGADLVEALTVDPPAGATVEATVRAAADGWNAPATEPWLRAALDDSSNAHFGRPAGAMGIGGSIPFMSMLGDRFPDAQFVITGVLGPESNAHGPNEFLHLPTARRVSACVAHVLDAHARR